jgi:glycosyltransferase involved in cell wall biosynthesis
MIVLIPAYQPDEQLPLLVESLRDADPALHVLVVDDGSGAAFDAVFAKAARFGAELLRYPINRGKGHALKVGFRHAVEQHAGDDVVCADSDGQHSVVDILRLATEVRRSGAMVLGVRAFSGPVPARSRFGNNVTRRLFRFATGTDITDTQTGLRGYPAAMLPWLLGVEGDRYEYELNLLLQATAARLPIESIEIATIYLAENQSSHFRPLADSARVYAPLLKFFGSSLLAFGIDTVALISLNAVTGSLLTSVVGARIISSTVNFLTNRRAVFDHGRDKPWLTAAAQYFGLVAVLLAGNYLLLATLTTAGVALLPAKVLTDVTLFAVSYLVQRSFVFARRSRRSTTSTTTATSTEVPAHRTQPVRVSA